MIAGPRGTVTNPTRSEPWPWCAGLGRHVVPDGAFRWGWPNVARSPLPASFLTCKSGIKASVGASPCSFSRGGGVYPQLSVAGQRWPRGLQPAPVPVPLTACGTGMWRFDLQHDFLALTGMELRGAVCGRRDIQSKEGLLAVARETNVETLILENAS